MDIYLTTIYFDDSTSITLPFSTEENAILYAEEYADTIFPDNEGWMVTCGKLDNFENGVVKH